MKRRTDCILACLFALAGVGIARAGSELEYAHPPEAATESRVRQELLDQLHPVRVNVSTVGITTLQFPVNVEALDGDGIQAGNDAGSSQGNAPVNADFVVSTGPNWVSVKALREGVEQNVSVVLRSRVYPILLTYSTRHDFAVLFSFRENTAIPGAMAAANAPGHPQAKPISAGRLLGLLDKVKGYPTFSQVQPAMYVGMDVNEPGTTRGSDDSERLHCQIRRVIRDNGLDAVAFEVQLTNKTDGTIAYDPEGFGVRVGNEVYAQTVSDAPGKVAPKATQTVYFVVAGSAESGHRNDLSVYNEFTPVVREVKGNG